MPTLSLLTFAEKMEQVRCFTAHTYVCIYVCASPLAENLPEIATKQKKNASNAKTAMIFSIHAGKIPFSFSFKKGFFLSC